MFFVYIPIATVFIAALIYISIVVRHMIEDPDSQYLASRRARRWAFGGKDKFLNLPGADEIEQDLEGRASEAVSSSLDKSNVLKYFQIALGVAICLFVVLLRVEVEMALYFAPLPLGIGLSWFIRASASRRRRKVA